MKLINNKLKNFIKRELFIPFPTIEYKQLKKPNLPLKLLKKTK
jgi:hypothetical protein